MKKDQFWLMGDYEHPQESNVSSWFYNINSYFIANIGNLTDEDLMAIQELKRLQQETRRSK